MGAESDDSGVEVLCARSGRVVAVAGGQSILEALGEAGIDVPWMCGAGFCGTCAVSVLAGHAEPSDNTPGAGRTVNVCTATSRSARLVLDI